MTIKTLTPLLFASALSLTTSASGAESPFGSDWPEGPGSQEAGALCGACHSLALVKQQGLSKESWDEVLTWMQEEQGMPELNAELRSLILEYLSTNFNPETHAQRRNNAP
ncbi:hypothetical protein [Hahella sp. CR1]|uniref:hypothetical protein n=1 Tax=unclassified Hahella TaxID=2624107 RepID=UPI0024435324|nr:hypothetical protein [Hahella sp. CR1]MDG9666398.1 hypothetical protein [Hahella sp. CR1]